MIRGAEAFILSSGWLLIIFSELALQPPMGIELIEQGMQVLTSRWNSYSTVLITVVTFASSHLLRLPFQQHRAGFG